MSIQKLLGKQRPLEYKDAAQDVLDYVGSTAGNTCITVQTAVAYGVILGKRMERAKRHNEPIAKIVRILRLANQEQLDSIYHFVLHYVQKPQARQKGGAQWTN